MSTDVVKIYSEAERYVYQSNFCISFASRPVKGKIYQVSDLQTCRDYAHEFTRLVLLCKNIKDKKMENGGYSFGYTPGKINKDIKLDINKLRLVIFSNGVDIHKNSSDTKLRQCIKKATVEELDERVFFTKQIINIYESYFDWPKSKIRKAEYMLKNCPALKDCWYITGSKLWMRNPHLLSLLTLTFRLIIRYGTFEYKTIEDIAKHFLTLGEKLSCKVYGTDASSFSILGHNLVTLLENYEDIFKDLYEEDLYHLSNKATSLNNFHSSGGILSLLSSTTGNKTLNERMRTAVVAARKKKEEEKYRKMSLKVGGAL